MLCKMICKLEETVGRTQRSTVIEVPRWISARVEGIVTRYELHEFMDASAQLCTS